VGPREQGTTTRSDRQRERTRRGLVDAARTLIAQKGVAGLRIQEITEQADVALGSFYNHFSSKEDLVEAVVSESLADLASAIVTSADEGTDPAEVVATAHLRFIRLAYDQPDFARLVVNLNHADALFANAVKPYARIALELGIANGRFVIADIEVVLTAVIGGAFAIIREVLEGLFEPGAELALTNFVLTSLGLSASDASRVLASASALIDS
jgi:AcrR family transcriptional regulator